MVLTPQKPNVETVKTVIIAVLVTAIIAFISGMQYEAHQANVIDQAVKAALK